ncbi:MAG: NADPH:quinone oxidoreductase family protein [Frankiales bacterium]|jgi:NADPH2:quinone reductase|nr:NADPH:quinone oxidoreductase family protein [Frankiales bacterium]
MRAIQITEFGGPEVLKLVDLPNPVAPDGFALLTVDSAGVNYADTHQVEDSYLSKATLPLVPGSEVVGRTADGRRLAAFAMNGGYCELAPVHPAMSFPVPDGVSDGQALALMVQGLTAWHLLRTSTHLQQGESVVVHAAAGGVGTLAVQLAKAWGAGNVIAVASSEHKRQLATELGADVTVDAGAEDLKSALEQANGSRKVDVVLEMVGGPTFDASLAALAPFGRLATFGMASRTPPRSVDAGALMSRSRAVIGFWLAHCFSRPEMLQGPMAELLAMVADGSLRPVVGGTYPLAEAHRAHEDLRSRRSTGKLVLDVRA